MPKECLKKRYFGKCQKCITKEDETKKGNNTFLKPPNINEIIELKGGN